MSSETLVDLLETNEVLYGKHRKQLAKELSQKAAEYAVHTAKKRKLREELKAAAAAAGSDAE